MDTPYGTKKEKLLPRSSQLVDKVRFNSWRRAFFFNFLSIKEKEKEKQKIFTLSCC